MTDSVQFPCLCIHKGTVFTVASHDALTSTSAAALRGGLFENLQIIDSTGAEFAVKSARKLHGLGAFWGYNVFLNQRIRVALEIVPTGKVNNADEVRKIVARDFATWHGWESRGDFAEIEKAVMNAGSSAEILQLLTRSS